jgi:hypothetical protein
VSVVANVAVNVDARQATQNLQRLQRQSTNAANSITKTGKSAASATANIQRFGIAFRSVLGPLVAVTGAVNLLGGSLRVLGERQADAAALENGLKKIGGTAGDLKRLQVIADQLGKQTLFNQEDFDRGFTLLTSFQSIGVSSYERVAKAAADVAQVTRQDVNSSLMQLAKALQDPEKGLTALARSGTQFTESQKEQVKQLVKSGQQLKAQDFILKEIEKQYGNAATAAGSAGYAGAVDSLQESFRDFQERLATGVEPAVAGTLKALSDLFDLVSKIPKPVGQAALAIGGVTAAVLGLRAAIIALLPVAKALLAFALANPWIALAAGITAAAVALAGYRNEAQRLGASARSGDAQDVAAARNKLSTVGQDISLLERQRQSTTGQARQILNRRIQRLRAQQQELKSGITAGTAAAVGTPAGISIDGGGDGGGAGGGGGGKTNQAEREAARALEIQKQQLKTADDQNFALKNRFAILQETEAVAKRQLELDVRLNEIAREYGELKENAKSNDELILINANSILEKKAAELEAEREINDLIAERVRLMAQLAQEALQPTVFNQLETQDAALQSILDKYPAIGAAADAAATLATSGIAAMIAGTKSAEQVFVEFLNAIANALISTAKQMIAQYIAIGIARMFAGIGSSAGSGNFAPSGPLAAVGDINPLPTSFSGLANGGPATSGTPYLVGERGPELFVPGSNGGVMSNNDLRSAMNNQGGGASGSPVLNMSFESTTIGGVEYVSRDQLEQAMAETRRAASRDGAQRGMSMTLDKLQQSPATRSRVGLR